MKKSLFLLLAYCYCFLLTGQSPLKTKEQFKAFTDSTKTIALRVNMEAGKNRHFYAIENGVDAYPNIYCDVLFDLAHIYNLNNQPDSAKYYLQLSNDLIIKESLTKKWPRFYLNNGNFYYGQRDFESANEQYSKGLDFIKQKFPESKMIGDLYSMLSSSYRNTKQLDSAIIMSQKALAHFKIMDDTLSMPKAINDIGLIYLIKKNYKKALPHFLEAYHYSKRNKLPRGHLFATSYIATIYQLLHLNKESKKYFEEAIEVTKKIGDNRALKGFQLNLAYTNLVLNQVNVADSILKEIKKISTEDPLHSCFRQNLEGLVYLEKGKDNLARKAFRTVVNNCSGYFNFLSMKRAHIGIAKIKYKNEGHLSALSYISDSLNNVSFSTSEKIALAELKNTLYIASNNYKAAHEALQEKLALQDTIKSKQTLAVTFTAQAEMELKDKQNEIEKLQFENNVIALKNQRRNILIGVLIFSIIGITILGYLLSRHNKIKLEKDLANVKQQLLRIQINPHFIFNILNSIQHSFLLNDEEKTIHLFTKFSNLMRQVLDNSNSSFIPLNEELEMLINYLELEKIRTNNKFDFSINIEDDVDIYMEEVPSMVLQIFVENSIWHGVSPKPTRGNININVAKENSKLKVTVEDDGVGRSFSLKHKSKDQKNKKSLGSILAIERIGLLNRKYGKNLQLKISDGHQNIGTKVELAI